jgi:hypothetical protein
LHYVSISQHLIQYVINIVIKYVDDLING